ncbi:solute carrier family 17 member 9 [Anopheles arabiensis]|uniref:Major facilitator superfamily (MFS) profile domain-containing protein n=7 Tax=gambiae species complex TaxID=44542 RepID=A0A1S4GZN2_ANOGA|nr:solute carrier family 17 member 9 [Anopheles arabiensis]XP_040231125.2 solute carrier family 17 member 9 [Anopheles coluzzii]XP_061510105.1 voltage-gated purine nucleotide uniporter SLC17A9 isoform X2 [Anopheles gambiae]
MMEEKLKYSFLRDLNDGQSIWTRNEKRTWFLTLLTGTCMLYSTRTTMPLLVPAVAAERKWSKTDSGTVLSSFFWGYTLTQVLGGYLSDKFGGQKVILLAAIGWSLITFWMPNIITSSTLFASYSIPFIVTVRIINGACQGVHFPSMISITSQNLSACERASFFSILTSGSALGTLLTGIVGSFLLDYFGWPTAFRVIGFLGLSWTLFLRYYTMASDRSRIINISMPSRMYTKLGTPDAVPWLRLFERSSFWACVLAHACEMNCFFVLLSWLPTYFHENFPHAKGWVVNMIPWLALPPVTFIGKLLTEHLLAKQWSLTRIRKLVQSLCFLGQNCALFLMCRTQDFNMALTCMSIIIGLSGLHNNAVTVNPQDLAPSHSGSVFGLMNTVGAIPGFLGVYLAGHILELTQSWSAVFSTAAAINTFGWLIFTVFGSAETIV